MEGNDMITNLYRLPKLEDRKDTIQIKRAFAGDKGAILNFIKSNFSDSCSDLLVCIPIIVEKMLVSPFY